MGRMLLHKYIANFIHKMVDGQAFYTLNLEHFLPPFCHCEYIDYITMNKNYQFNGWLK